MTRFYTQTHEWISLDGEVATVGISDVAVKLLTDLIFLNLPETGLALKAGESFGEIESVKAVSDILSPADGEVIEVNAPIADALETLAADPLGAGWLIKMKITTPLPETLIDEKSYSAMEHEH